MCKLRKVCVGCAFAPQNVHMDKFVANELLLVAQ